MGAALHAARQAFLVVRAGLRKMGELADVPVEPQSQTKLVDATMQVPGVLFTGVPGGM